MKAALASFWREIVTPSLANEPPYTFLLIAVAHAMLGASVANAGEWAFGLAAARAIIPLAYWIVKEMGDLKRGGHLRDGIIDAGFVTLGCTYTGPAWWPITILALAFICAIASASPICCADRKTKMLYAGPRGNADAR